MSHLLILARGDARTYRSVDGSSLLDGLPFDVTLFADKGNGPELRALEGEHEIVVVRWSDEDEVVNRAVQLQTAVPFTAITTFDEQLVGLAARIRDALGLPGMSPEAAELFRNKMRMKEVLDAAGVRTPHASHASDRAAAEALLAQHGKIVVKPVAGLGARDVVFIDTAEQLDAWYAEGKNAAEFEAEEFIDGTLYHVNAVVRDGVPLLTGSAIYVPGMGNIDFSAGTPFVSAMVTEPVLKGRLERFSDAVIAALGMRNGVTHLECFVKDDGEIVFCEVGARPGGGGIVWMLEKHCGINYNRALMLLEAGRGDLLQIPAQQREGLVGLMGFRSAQSAFITRAAGQADFAEDWIHVRQIDIGQGAFKPASAHCTDFLGLFVFSSRDMQDFEQRRLNLSERFYNALEMQPV